MKKITVFTLIFCLSIGMFFGYGKTSKAKESVKGTCGATQDIDMEETYLNEQGNLVQEFENGIIVEYFANGEIEVTDQFNVMNANLDELPETGKARIDWVLIGKILWNTIGGCSAVQYVTGYDLCKIALQYLSSPKPNTTYAVYAFKEATHIPGCYPSSSPQCIKYNVKYRFVIMN